MAAQLTFILGCTGCGKNAVGQELARRLGAEIISVDSMKVFRRMDVGTAKPDAAIRAEIPHHLIDVVEPCEDFSVAQFVRLAEQAIADIAGRNKPILCVGGTALYIKALTEGLFEGPSAHPQLRAELEQRARDNGTPALHAELAKVDPAAAERIHPNDLRRIVRALEVYKTTGSPISALQTQWDRQRPRRPFRLIGLRRTREDQNRCTNARVKRMIENGLVDEVRSLLAEPRPLSPTARQALGYAEIIEHLDGKLSLDDAVEMIKINTRKFTKAQRTWFKRFRETQWIDLAPGDRPEAVAAALPNTMDETGWKAPKSATGPSI